MSPSPRRSSPLAPLLFRPSPTPPRLALPLFGCSVRAGFPSPATDYVSEHLDLNEHLIAHKEATFFLRTKGHSMVGTGDTETRCASKSFDNRFSRMRNANPADREEQPGSDKGCPTKRDCGMEWRATDEA